MDACALNMMVHYLRASKQGDSLKKCALRCTDQYMGRNGHNPDN